MNGSQCDRVLAVLRDGRPHTMEEIHQFAGFMRLNSRISDLRHRGYEITCNRVDGRYVYRLLGRLEEADTVRDGSASSSTPPNPTEAKGPLSPFVAPTEPRHRDGGVLELFACEVDESAGLRGAYWDDAA